MPGCPNCGHENRDAARFCEDCGTPLDPIVTRQSRRTVTAVFCDLVGSTALAERYDPEVLRPVLQRYFTQMREAVEHHGGRVEKYIGDAVVAVFGLPTAHEDDALRSVRAALEMLTRMRTLDDEVPMPLACRIGVTTGEILVQPDGGPLLGDVMNTASRLQSAAEPGEVWIGEPTQLLVRDQVAVQKVGPIDAKGKSEPVSAFRVLGVEPVMSRAPTPFVGRQRQLGILQDALRDAVEEDAPVIVTILAPPGVGKTRLATEFSQVPGEDVAVLVGHTPPYGDGVTFAPLIELLSEAASLPGGSAEHVVDRLRDLILDQPDAEAVGARLAQVLGVGEAVPSEASWAVRRLLEVLAAERPLLVVLEDLHWAEPPMLDLLEAVTERVHGPVMFLALARPEFLEQRPGWAAGKPRALTRTLPGLSPPDAQLMADALLGSAPTAVVDRICDVAEGNPLYLEQLTATLEDQGLVSEQTWMGADETSIEIPTSLQALLTSRLDRLEPVPRLVLERASIDGRRFRVAAVTALAPEVPAADFDAALETLERRGLIVPEREGSGTWRFTHALLVDATYRGLSKALRADLHERLATWMEGAERHRPDLDESMARHLERSLRLREELGLRDERTAALAERAGRLYASAGTRAFAATDLASSRDLLSRAAALLPTSSPLRTEILPNLASALADSGEAAASDAVLNEALGHARSLGRDRDALRASIQILSNQAYESNEDAEIAPAVAEAERAFRSFHDGADQVGMAEAAIVLDNLAYVCGHTETAMRWATTAVRNALAAGRPREAIEGAGDLLGLAVAGPVPFSRLESDAERLLEVGDEVTDVCAFALHAAAALAAGDVPAFEHHEAQRLEATERHGLGFLGAAHGVSLSVVELSVGRASAAEDRLQKALEFFTRIENIWWMTLSDSLLSEAIYRQGRSAEFVTRARAPEASALMTDRHGLVRAQMLHAWSELEQGSPASAEKHIRRALDLLVSTDLVQERVNANTALADSLLARGLDGEAHAARSAAATLLRDKGNVAAADRLSL